MQLIAAQNVRSAGFCARRYFLSAHVDWTGLDIQA